MPMIDVYAPTDLFPVSADRQLAEELTAALLKAEGVANPGPTHTNNTGAYIHRMPPSTVNTAAQGSARTVRVQVVTPPGVLSRAGQKQLVAEATEIVARISGDPTQSGRTWVLLTEAAEGGWGIAGTALCLLAGCGEQVAPRSGPSASVGTARLSLTDDAHLAKCVKVLAKLAGKVRRHRIRVVLGDRVTVAVSPYDPTRGFIVYRQR